MGAKSVRTQMGMDIIELMEKNGDLPMPNVHRLAKTMMEYFRDEGMGDDLFEAGYSWRPNEDYWRMHLSDIRQQFRKERKKYFEFVRNEGLKGNWKFVNKNEYLDTLKFDNNDISTRVDTYNDKVQGGQERWKINVVNLSTIPRIASN